MSPKNYASASFIKFWLLQIRLPLTMQVPITVLNMQIIIKFHDKFRTLVQSFPVIVLILMKSYRDLEAIGQVTHLPLVLQWCLRTIKMVQFI